jgi:S-adenosylmethionine-diacylgycerolhomoserine-N-methlytransferase
LAIGAEVRILWQMLRGASGAGDHAHRLEQFYAPQAQGYDAFRERLLHGRRELIARLPVYAGARVIELGAGTGRNLEFFGERLATFASVELVDLCPALLEVARERLQERRNVRLVDADAGEYRPASPPDCAYFSYVLTMIPDWRRAIDNAIAMLAPGGTLGVVDFHLPDDGLGSRFWRAWFGHDGVWLSAEHLPYLRSRLEELLCEERSGPLPYLPGLRVPYYLFVGRKR